MRACDNKANPFESVWSTVVKEGESVWQGGPFDHSPQGRPWPELRASPGSSHERCEQKRTATSGEAVMNEILYSTHY